MNIYQKISLIGFFIGLIMVASLSIYNNENKYIIYVVVLGSIIALSCALAYSISEVLYESISSTNKSTSKVFTQPNINSNGIASVLSPAMIVHKTESYDNWSPFNFPPFSSHALAIDKCASCPLEYKSKISPFEQPVIEVYEKTENKKSRYIKEEEKPISTRKIMLDKYIEFNEER